MRSSQWKPYTRKDGTQAFNIPDTQAKYTYRRVSNIRRTKFQNLNVSRLIL